MANTRLFTTQTETPNWINLNNNIIQLLALDYLSIDDAINFSHTCRLFHSYITPLIKAKLLTIQDNIRHNIHRDSLLSLEGEMVKITRCHNWLATLNWRRVLSLYNVAIPKMMWSLRPANTSGWNFHSIQVGNDGLVLYIESRLEAMTSYNIHIYFQAELTGKLLIETESFQISSIRIMNGRIFGMYISQDKSIFNEWSKTGVLVRSIPMDINNQGIEILINCNEEYYVILSADDNLKLQPVFVFDLNKNHLQGFFVELEGEILSDIYLFKNWIICSSYHWRTIGSIVRSKCDQRIHILNITTMKIESNARHVITRLLISLTFYFVIAILSSSKLLLL